MAPALSGATLSNTRHDSASTPFCVICTESFEDKQIIAQPHSSNPTLSDAGYHNKSVSLANENEHLFHIQCLSKEIAHRHKKQEGARTGDWSMHCPLCRHTCALSEIQLYDVTAQGLSSNAQESIREAFYESVESKALLCESEQVQSDISPAQLPPLPQSRLPVSGLGRHPSPFHFGTGIHSTTNQDTNERSTLITTALVGLGAVASITHAPLAIIAMGAIAIGAFIESHPFERCQQNQRSLNRPD